MGAKTGDRILDFETGTDQFSFLSSAFGLGVGGLTQNTDFFIFSSGTGYDGTSANFTAAGLSDDTPGAQADYFVFDTTQTAGSESGTLYYDDDIGTNGFTVVTTVEGNAVAVGDMQVLATV